MKRMTKRDKILHGRLLARCLDFNAVSVSNRIETMKEIYTLRDCLVYRGHRVSVLVDSEINKVRGYAIDGAYRRLYRDIREGCKKV